MVGAGVGQGNRILGARVVARHARPHVTAPEGVRGRGRPFLLREHILVGDDQIGHAAIIDRAVKFAAVGKDDAGLHLAAFVAFEKFERPGGGGLDRHFEPVLRPAAILTLGEKLDGVHGRFVDEDKGIVVAIIGMGRRRDEQGGAERSGGGK